MEDIDDLLRTTEQPAIVKPKPVNPRAQKDPIEESSEDEFIDSEALTVQGRMFFPVQAIQPCQTGRQLASETCLRRQVFQHTNLTGY